MNAYIKALSILATIAIVTLIANDAHAQCSGGGSRSGRAGGQPPQATGSTNLFASTFNQTPLLAYQRQIAYQQLSKQRQRSNETAARLSQQRQEVFATRLARAEAKRAKRADRTAARIALRLGESSGSMIAATESRSTLVSLQDASPFH